MMFFTSIAAEGQHNKNEKFCLLLEVEMLIYRESSMKGVLKNERFPTIEDFSGQHIFKLLLYTMSFVLVNDIVYPSPFLFLSFIEFGVIRCRGK